MADTPTPLTRRALRELASVQAGPTPVLSLFVNLDPGEFGTREARESAVNGAADELSKAAERAGDDLSHDARQALGDDVARVRKYVTGTDLAETQALAVFAGPGDLFRAFHLDAPLPSAAHAEATPAIGALAAAIPAESWGVLLANSEGARFMRGDRNGFSEEGSFHEEVTGEASRDQASAEEEARANARRAAQALATGLRRAPVDQLILAAPDQTLPLLREELPQELGEIVRGTIGVDVGSASESEVTEAADPVISRYEDQRIGELLERVQAGLGTDGRAAAETAPVLAALSEQRVQTLLLDAGFHAAGVECVRCGWLGVEQRAEGCPADGGELREHENIAEQAIERALGQDAELVTVADRPELGPHGGIAAVLRF